MKKTFIAMALVALTACNANHDNPVLKDSSLPFGAPEFAKYESTHYEPAFMEGFAEQRAEIDAIVANPEAPTFDNTIAALERGGKKLAKVTGVFFNLNETDADDVMREAEKRLSPLFTEHSAYMTMNEALFARIKTLYDDKANLGLTREQEMVLDKYYRMFVKGGALLDADKKAQLMEIEKQLSLASIEFGENALAETNAFELVITDEKDLSGLPQSSIIAAREAAQAAGKEGYLFTLHKPSWIPFLQYADNRELRRQMYLGYINRGDNNNENDNKEVIKKLVELRLKRAQIMGAETAASYILEDRMAKTPEAVYELLDQIWKPALKAAKAEAKDMQKIIAKEGSNITLEAWDWRYYAQKAMKEKFNLSEEEMAPYFQIDNVREGVFHVANKLFGLTFKKLENVPLPHEEAEAFEVYDNDGTVTGIVFFDMFARPGQKRAGAWCGGFRGQSYKNGERVLPLVTICGNFTRPVGDKPALLTTDEVGTYFHEFGHGLASLLKDVKYKGMGGYPRDFVELPSQLNEHWAFEPEVLKVYAKHYQTGEVIPQELVEKMEKAGKYGQGFATVEYLAASYLDMDFHVLKEVPADLDVEKFEEKSLGGRGILSQIPSRYRSTYFSHTFTGGYTAGYYSYIWAEVLDADAYDAFCETGDIFSQEVATKYRKEILEVAGERDAMDLYISFRGKQPGIDPLLKNRGLK